MKIWTSGTSTDLLTAAQMRSIEAEAIGSGRVTGLELMERAGRGVVEALLSWRPEMAVRPHKAVVLCGPGNNGGDGFVIARLLARRGWEVEVYLYSPEPFRPVEESVGALPPDARTNALRWQETGTIQRMVSLPYEFDDRFRPDLLVDAIFGTGLTRPVDDHLRGHLTAINREMHGGVILAVDLPSGLCADSGRMLTTAEQHTGMQLPEGADMLRASLTVTFHQPRLGHMLADGPRVCGDLAVADIGLDLVRGRMHLEHQRASPDRSTRLTPGVILAEGTGVLGKDRAHKYEHGHALVLAGGVGRGGAGRLAARGALRVGAGLVTVVCPPAALQENAARLDAIMLRAVKDADGLGEMLRDERINAICLGPGLGVGARTRELVAAACAPRRPDPFPHPDRGLGVVLDADALTSFADDPDALFALLHRRCVLTPHMGEFARLFPDLARRLADPPVRGPAYSRIDAVRDAAARSGAVVLLKGADTAIAEPDLGRAWVSAAHYDRRAPWLATAGSGDVLAGLITGLLSRMFAAPHAAEIGAWLHVECARRFGPGLIAEDLPEQLPAVFRDLGA